MATTTNYGWTTPDDTALVKDGAAAIRTLGSSVDTTTKALNPSTTLGDIEYRSSTANTNTRLGIGTTGQVLLVSGGVPAWGTPAGGKVLQVVSTAITAKTSLTSNGTARVFDDVTGFSASITPTSASSKVLVIAQISAAGTSVQTNARLFIRLMRASTAISIGDAGTGVSCSATYFFDNGYHPLNNSIVFLDSPSTTSATTYKIQHAANQTSQTIIFNGGNATEATDYGRTASSIILMEIGA
jgi:hypothetical protein